MSVLPVKKIIDCHAHIGPEKGYLPKLIDTMRKNDIVCAWLHAVEEPFDKSYIGGNKEVRDAFMKYPGLFRGFGYIRLGGDTVSDVDELHAAGFSGLKVIYPSSRYDDKRYYRIYERAQKYGMPIMFHLGAGLYRPKKTGYDISIDYMRPAHLDTIARAFPVLSLIGAHFGNPWYEEAAEVARLNPNVYFDLTGSTLVKKSPAFFKDLLWWKDTLSIYRGSSSPFEKVLFGTDVPPSMIGDVKKDYENLVQCLDLNKTDTENIFRKNALRILKPKAVRSKATRLPAR